MAVSLSDIRYRLVQQDDEVTLPEAMINVFIDDATTLKTQPTDKATELYTCYLIAKSWQGLGFIKLQDGVGIAVPDAQKYLDMWNTLIAKNGGTSTTSPFKKVQWIQDFHIIPLEI